MPVEELTLKMASLANILDWLTQPKGPHLVNGTSTADPLTALAILVTPEALYDPDSGATINVMYTQVWGGPRATKHTKNASYRGGRAAD